MNSLDLVLPILLLTSGVVGFFAGSIRTVVSLICAYLAILLTSFLFPPIGSFVHRALHTGLIAGALLGFAILLCVSFILLTGLSLYALRNRVISQRFLVIDRVAGTFAGLLLGGLLVSIGALLLKQFFTTDTVQPLAGLLPRFSPFMSRTVRASSMIIVCVDRILPFLLAIIQPVLPDTIHLIMGTYE